MFRVISNIFCVLHTFYPVDFANIYKNQIVFL